MNLNIQDIPLTNGVNFVVRLELARGRLLFDGKVRLDSVFCYQTTMRTAINLHRIRHPGRVALEHGTNDT